MTPNPWDSGSSSKANRQRRTAWGVVLVLFGVVLISPSVSAETGAMTPQEFRELQEQYLEVPNFSLVTEALFHEQMQQRFTPDTARDFLETLLQDDSHRSLYIFGLKELFALMARQYPEEAVRLTKQFDESGGWPRADLITAALRPYQEDPEKIEELLEPVDDPFAEMIAKFAHIYTPGRRSPQEAGQYVLSLESAENRGALVTRAFSRYAMLDLMGSIRLLDQFANRKNALSATYSILDQLEREGTPAQMEDAYVLAGQLEAPFLRHRIQQGILGLMARENPEKVAELLRNYPFVMGSYLDPEPVSTVARFLLEQDPATAREWATDLASAQAQHIARRTITKASFALEPQETLDWLDTIEEESRRAHFLRELVDDWVENHRDLARDWILRHDQEEIGGGVSGIIKNLLEKWAETDAVAAWELSVQLQNEYARANVLRAITSKLVEADAPGAALRVEQLPPGEGREDAAQALVSAWARQDFPAAKRWVDALEPGDTRDAAVYSLTYVIGYSNYQQRADLLATLHDPKFRETHLKSFLASWLRDQEDQALQWIAQSSLSQELRDKILERHERRPQ